MKKEALKQFILDRAFFYGFSHVGVAKAEFMEEEARHLEQWLNNDHQGQMNYLENHFDKRVDPTKLVPGAKSVISLAFNYYPEQDIESEGNFKIARYAYGKDYHKWIKKKLIHLLHEIEEKIARPINGRAFVDSAPVLERDWAKRSGMGWVGKNTLLLNKKKGSYFFLAELITDLELAFDHPVSDHCGTCTKCIDACPTDAISPTGYILDASKCISYLTIELKDRIPSEFQGKMDDWIFGCDICQEVCPWNRFSTPTKEEKMQPNHEIQSFRKKEWQEITEELFHQVFQGTAVKRTKYQGFIRNVRFLE